MVLLTLVKAPVSALSLQVLVLKSYFNSLSQDRSYLSNTILSYFAWLFTS